jgi:hypothetical protein
VAPLAHRALLADMRQSLRSEIGARAMYGLLARRDDGELAQVLAVFHEDEQQQIECLIELMRTLGARPRARSVRRELAARALYAATFLGAHALALRACYESERSLQRGYHGHADYLERCDLHEPARAALQLASTKARHARILEAWVGH